MKRTSISRLYGVCQFLFLAAAAALLQSCNFLGGIPSADGQLRIAFAKGQELLTRSGLEIPDTSDFLLTIKDSKGVVVYDGKYGDSPESLTLRPGSYTVSVVSEEFNKPAFSLPQFGDEQCVVVPAGDIVTLKLLCRQLNSGIRLIVDPVFLTKYPDGVLLLKSNFGRLMYGYAERRIAYFAPGNISLVLANEGTDQVLFTKMLHPQEILELKVRVSGSGSESDMTGESQGISIAVDTTRVWLSEDYTIGGGLSSGGSVLSVADARSMVGEEDVLVCGYIVGGDLTSSSASFAKPFSSRTNMLLGSRPSTSDKASCLSVQLSSGDIRDDLNLVDNPGLLGRKVRFRGDIVEAYYGIPGIKNISEYELQ